MRYHGDEANVVETIDNPIGKIPAVHLPSNRSIVRGIGVSDISDIEFMQRAIYQELSEIEQLIRISNHPTLVKTYDTDASAGAGAVINISDDMDAGLKPYQMQPSGANLDAIRASIEDKIESINRMAHMGAVRGTEAITQSGVAMQTEFQMLNAKLAEKADILELAEEIVGLVYMARSSASRVNRLPDGFDIRDYDQSFDSCNRHALAALSLSPYCVRSTSRLQTSYSMIRCSHRHTMRLTRQLRSRYFAKETQIYKYHIDSGLVTPNEVREKIGLDEVTGGDQLMSQCKR